MFRQKEAGVGVFHICPSVRRPSPSTYLHRSPRATIGQRRPSCDTSCNPLTLKGYQCPYFSTLVTTRSRKPYAQGKDATEGVVGTSFAQFSCERAIWRDRACKPPGPLWHCMSLKVAQTGGAATSAIGSLTRVRQTCSLALFDFCKQLPEPGLHPLFQACHSLCLVAGLG